MKLLVPLTVTILTYLLLSLVWADYGVLAYERLGAYKARLEANVERLEGRRDELSTETRSLRTNSDRIRVEARRLGYYEQDEGLVRVEGYDPQAVSSSPGAFVKRPIERRGGRDHAAIIRAVAASAGLLALFLMLVLEQRGSR
ncbi:MAG: septum formation initiator family protein [Spirochaetaceae bacterium]